MRQSPGLGTLALHEARNRNVPELGQAPPVKLDSFKLMQRFSGHIAFSAMGADDDGHVLDDEQIGSFAIAARYLPDVSATLPTNVTEDCFGVISHKR